jgi:tetratricopeptide (TPR) repeat protein
MLSEGRELSIRGLYYYARELYYNARYPEAIVYFNKFLETGQGWVEDNITACSMLSKCYAELKDTHNTLFVLLKSFGYDTPRAEICCQLGYYYKDLCDYPKAIFWFELAGNLKKPETTWGFMEHDCWTYIPAIELCVCHYRLGNIEESIKYNDQAEQYKPDAAPVLYNKKLFTAMKK